MLSETNIYLILYHTVVQDIFQLFFYLLLIFIYVAYDLNPFPWLGIDIKDVSLVINYDMAKTIEMYTHR